MQQSWTQNPKSPMSTVLVMYIQISQGARRTAKLNTHFMDEGLKMENAMSPKCQQTSQSYACMHTLSHHLLFILSFSFYAQFLQSHPHYLSVKFSTLKVSNEFNAPLSSTDLKQELCCIFWWFPTFSDSWTTEQQLVSSGILSVSCCTAQTTVYIYDNH
jgi:hypothetical protein